MHTAWKRFGAMFSSFLAPLMDRRVGNAQLAGHLRDRLATGLGYLHRFMLKLWCIGPLDILHDPCPPSGTVYPKLSLLHKSGARSILAYSGPQNERTFERGLADSEIIMFFLKPCLSFLNLSAYF